MMKQSPYSEDQYRKDISSPSSQRKLNLLENKELMTLNNLTIMNSYNPNREDTIDKINFTNDIVNWTIKDSIAETRLTLNNLKNDLSKLVLKENVKRNEYNHNR
jgi:hypothetical protein